MSESNLHNRLYALKHRLSCEVLAKFPLSVICEHARTNLLRWTA
jgi:hypothetical protein